MLSSAWISKRARKPITTHATFTKATIAKEITAKTTLTKEITTIAKEITANSTITNSTITITITNSTIAKEITAPIFKTITSTKPVCVKFV